MSTLTDCVRYAERETEMARKLNKHFLNGLQNEFPFLKEWKPVLHSASRSVTFKVARVLDPNTVWKLEFGRYNNEPDDSYTDGVTWIAISDGESLEWIRLKEGETSPADVLEEDTRYILVEDVYRSMLVENNEGCIEFTLYKRGEDTVEQIKEESARAARAMRAELEA